MKSLYLIPYTKNRIIILYFLEVLKSRYKKVELIKVISIDETISKFEKSTADFILLEGNLEIVLEGDFQKDIKDLGTD
jgi:hypothetical protein